MNRLTVKWLLSMKLCPLNWHKMEICLRQSGNTVKTDSTQYKTYSPQYRSDSTQHRTDGEEQLKYMKHIFSSSSVHALWGRGGYVIMSLFRMVTAEGTNYFLYPFFLASGTLSLLPDGKGWNDEWRGCTRVYNDPGHYRPGCVGSL